MADLSVNERSEMIEATRMGVKAIMTDKPSALLELYKECEADWDKVSSETGWTFGWFTPRYYSWVNVRTCDFTSLSSLFTDRRLQRTREKAFETLLQAMAGSFDAKPGSKVTASSVAI